MEQRLEGFISSHVVTSLMTDNSGTDCCCNDVDVDAADDPDTGSDNNNNEAEDDESDR
jgi:hypothetical protein